MQYLKKAWLFSLIFCLNGIHLDAQNTVWSETIDEIAQKYIKKAKNKGMVIGIVQGEYQEVKGYGRLSNRLKQAPDENTLFEIGAISSVFTNTLAMQLSLEGHFDFAEPIQDYLPDKVYAPVYHSLKCIEITLPPNPYSPRKKRLLNCVPDPAEEAASPAFCDLASHSSGLSVSAKGCYSWTPFAYIRDLTEHNSAYSKKAFYQDLHQFELTTTPGTKFRYSNLGVAILGNVLEDITGQDFPQLLDKKITAPLKMNDTRFYLNADQVKRMAPGHNSKGQEVGPWHLNAMKPAGGLRSTGADMLRFLRANLYPPDDAFRDVIAQLHQSRLDVNVPGRRLPTQVGYGWLISPLNEASTERVTWLNGGTGGYRSFIGIVKEKGIGVVVLSNSANPVDEVALEILEALTNSAPSKNRLP